MKGKNVQMVLNFAGGINQEVSGLVLDNGKSEKSPRRFRPGPLPDIPVEEVSARSIHRNRSITVIKAGANRMSGKSPLATALFQLPGVEMQPRLRRHCQLP